jgi:DNA-binding transcriptional ArsR family regulator
MVLPRRNLDVRALKALAHPLRQRIFYHLAFSGEATATSVARAFGENTGATSYHLRRLADAGLIEEVPKATGGRERRWRIVPLDLRAPAGGADEEGRLSDEWSLLQLDRDERLVRRFVAAQADLGEAASEATLSSSAARLTPAELKRFGEEYIALVNRYYRAPEDAPEDAIPVALILYAFPWPGEPT